MTKFYVNNNWGIGVPHMLEFVSLFVRFIRVGNFDWKFCLMSYF